MQPVCIMFCQHPLDHKSVDPDFEGEFNAAKRIGFTTQLFNFDLFCDGNTRAALAKIPFAEDFTHVIYRGWMLNVGQYDILFKGLTAKNYYLINTQTEFRNCHYLPDSLRFIKEKTPISVYGKIFSPGDIELLADQVKIFINRSVIIKDYVKSEKHHWETACFVNDASDRKSLIRTINNLLELRGEYLNEGIVVREYVDLKRLTNHSKSGMPLNEEYRLFFFKKTLLKVFNYWDEGEYPTNRLDVSEFELIAQGVESNFFTMDIARRSDDSFIIIELGDGQMAGLPDNADVGEFYANLHNLCSHL